MGAFLNVAGPITGVFVLVAFFDYSKSNHNWRQYIRLAQVPKSYLRRLPKYRIKAIKESHAQGKYQVKRSSRDDLILNVTKNSQGIFEFCPIEKGTSSASPKRPDVFRVVGIHQEATKDALIAALCAEFLDHEKDIIIDATIVPSCDGTDDTNTGLVCFYPYTPRFLESLYEGREDVQIEKSEIGDLNIDKNFYGLTQLYPTIPGGKITADIIAVTGLDGHAYGSWRGRTKSAKMWLRDFFSEDLPTCRTMIYGYNSKLGSASIHTIHDFATGFLEDMKRARTTKEEIERPIIFLGHSIGGVVVLTIIQSLISANRGDSTARSMFNATKALMFFGTPHRGLPIDDILSMVDEEKHGERAELVRSIDRESGTLEASLQKFIGIAERFKIFSFYELKKSKKLGINGTWTRSGDYVVPVSPDSALLKISGETRIPVDRDHSGLVKFTTKQDRTYRSAISYLWQLT
ncbi:hypothetical protein K440DRAFT_565337, partial [Wilcoxina mikolae CBS 423.85]